MNAVLEQRLAKPTNADLEDIERVRVRLNSVLRGKSDVVQFVLACLLARGHLLLEDRPGLGKTTLAKTLADALGGRFARVSMHARFTSERYHGFQYLQSKVT